MQFAHSVDDPTMLAPLARELTGVLERLFICYERVLVLIREQRQAVSKADAVALERSARELGNVDKQVRALDQKRGGILQRTSVGHKSATSITAFASKLHEGDRTPLEARAHALRSILKTVHQEQEVLRETIAHVLGHMDGVRRQIAQALDAAGTYSGPTAKAGGATHPLRAGSFAVDLTS